jgi:hypothetical protein
MRATPIILIELNVTCHTSRLLKATEDIGWPKKVEYHSIPADKRKEFEVAFRELLSLQAEYVPPMKARA